MELGIKFFLLYFCTMEICRAVPIVYKANSEIVHKIPAIIIEGIVICDRILENQPLKKINYRVRADIVGRH